MEKVSNDAYKLRIPPCIEFYLVVNVENPKLYEPSILDEDKEVQVLISIQQLTSDAHVELLEDTILQKKIIMTKRDQQELW